MALKMILTSLDGLSEELTKLYVKRDDKYELQVEGAKTQIDIDKIQAALNSERAISKGFKNQLDAWGDRKPEDVLPILDKLPELEAAAEAGKKKLDQSQIDGIVNGRLAPLQRDLEKARKDLTESQAKATQYEQAQKRRTVHDAMRAAIAESGADPKTYADDLGAAMLLADMLYTVTDAGQVVVKENAPGGLLHGTSVKDTIPQLQASHGYLWPSSKGGGAPGSKGGPPATENPFKGNNFTARSEFARENKDKPEVIANAIKDAGLAHAGETYKGK
jgi:hypothetical protein